MVRNRRARGGIEVNRRKTDNGQRGAALMIVAVVGAVVLTVALLTLLVAYRSFVSSAEAGRMLPAENLAASAVTTLEDSLLSATPADGGTLQQLVASAEAGPWFFRLDVEASQARAMVQRQGEKVLLMVTAEDDTGRRAVVKNTYRRNAEGGWMLDEN